MLVSNVNGLFHVEHSDSHKLVQECPCVSQLDGFRSFEPWRILHRSFWC